MDRHRWQRLGTVLGAPQNLTWPSLVLGGESSVSVLHKSTSTSEYLHFTGMKRWGVLPCGNYAPLWMVSAAESVRVSICFCLHHHPSFSWFPDTKSSADKSVFDFYLVLWHVVTEPYSYLSGKHLVYSKQSPFLPIKWPISNSDFATFCLFHECLPIFYTTKRIPDWNKCVIVKKNYRFISLKR